MKQSIWMAFCLLTLFATASAQQSRLRIAVIDAHIDKAEMAALKKGAGNWKDLSFKLLAPADLLKAGVLQQFTHVWYHRTDTGAFDRTEKMIGTPIKQFVRNGGNLFLSMEAMPLLNEWGIEQAPIGLRCDTLTDE